MQLIQHQYGSHHNKNKERKESKNNSSILIGPFVALIYSIDAIKIILLSFVLMLGQHIK